MRIETVIIPAMRWVLDRPRLTDALFKLDSWGNPFSDEFVEDPMVMADEVRAGGPIQWKPLYQQWFISGYDESREVLTSPHTGTSNQVEVLEAVSPFSKMSPRSKTFLRNILLLTDPPQHTRLRGLVNRAFTPRQVSRLDERMKKLVNGLIADFGPQRVELMGEFASQFPSVVIADLFGLPEEDRPWLLGVSKVIAQLLDPFRGFDPAEMDAAIDDFHRRIIELAEERRRDPAEDLLTGLALVEADDGDRLSEDELVAVAGIILVAGHETTAGMIGLSMVMLHDHPDQLALVKARSELWPNAIEELLRFDTSVRSIPRAALVDFELRGHKIKKDQNILVMPQMANRDPRRFDDYDRLRLDREDPAPLSFGQGIHYCLGANLAKAELGVALPALVDALGDFTINRSEIEWRRSITIRTPDRLPITRG